MTLYWYQDPAVETRGDPMSQAEEEIQKHSSCADYIQTWGVHEKH